MTYSEKRAAMSETATMLKNGEIEVKVLKDITDKAKANFHYTLTKDHADYDKYRKRFGLEKPGDWKMIETSYLGGEPVATDSTLDVDFADD